MPFKAGFVLRPCSCSCCPWEKPAAAHASHSAAALFTSALSAAALSAAAFSAAAFSAAALSAAALSAAARSAAARSAAARSAAAFRSAASYHGIVALLWLYYLLGAVACGGLAYCGYSCLGIDCQDVPRRTCN